MAYDGPSVTGVSNLSRMFVECVLFLCLSPHSGDPATACAVSLASRCLKLLNTSDLPMAKATTCERPPTCGGYFACRSVSSEADSSEDRLAALAMDLNTLVDHCIYRSMALVASHSSGAV